MTKDTSTFDVVDPYNDNHVTGFIHHTNNTKYGMLEIETVNGKECYQEIWATPKMHYPMTIDNRWINPDFDSFIMYEKIDGTNILGFQYHDADGNNYISYKTRKTAFLRKSFEYNDFYTLWNTILEMYPKIPELINLNGYSLAFELYGKKNVILVEYDVLIDIVLLYGVDHGDIIAPENIISDGVPVCPMIKRVDRSMKIDEFKDAYQEMTDFLNSKLIAEYEEAEGEEPKIKRILEGSMEGSMFYCIKDGIAKQYKAKPDIIRDLHMAGAGGIPMHSIIITIKNAFEDTEDPTYDMVKEMLMEEFEEHDIEKKEGKIRNTIFYLTAERKLKKEIYVQYIEQQFDIVNDKRTCMRWFGERYDKKMASMIYRFLIDNFGWVE